MNSDIIKYMEKQSKRIDVTLPVGIIGGLILILILLKIF